MHCLTMYVKRRLSRGQINLIERYATIGAPKTGERIPLSTGSGLRTFLLAPICRNLRWASYAHCSPQEPRRPVVEGKTRPKPKKHVLSFNSTARQYPHHQKSLFSWELSLKRLIFILFLPYKTVKNLFTHNYITISTSTSY